MRRPGVFAKLAVSAVCATGLARAEAAVPPDPDPADWMAVTAVCGRCHSTDLFANSLRSWLRWNDVFAAMTKNGATGSDDQLERVTRYFLKTLTTVNVNLAPPDEIAGVLGVPDGVAAAIVARRDRRKFKDARELMSVSGVSRRVVDSRRKRILF